MNIKKFIIIISLIFIIAVYLFLILDTTLRPIIIVTALALSMLMLVYFSSQNDVDYLKNLILAIGIATTIVSWFFIGYINNENEKKRNLLEFERSTNQSKRDLKVKFLLDAYFRLENSDMRDAPDGSQQNLYDDIYKKYAESALTSVQLLGSDSTIKLANKFILSGGSNHYSDLLRSLRNEIRYELNLQELPNSEDYTPSTFRTFRKLSSPKVLTADQEFQLTIRLNELSSTLLK